MLTFQYNLHNTLQYFKFYLLLRFCIDDIAEQIASEQIFVKIFVRLMYLNFEKLLSIHLCIKCTIAYKYFLQLIYITFSPKSIKYKCLCNNNK